GALHCARCKSRLLDTLVKGNGGTYEYFVCAGRHTGRTGCDLPYVPLYKIEAAVAKLWHNEQAMWETDGIAQIEQELLEQLKAAQVSADRDLTERQIDKTNRERYKWADKAMDGAVPADNAGNNLRRLYNQAWFNSHHRRRRV
ncbi:MAG: recombinase zinc ribbon domain-containing protein, partial [Dermatophilaceae bacterium]